MTADDLVERVMAAMYHDPTDVRTATRRGIAIALEDAAKVCDQYAKKDWRLGEGFRNRAALDLAAAIRAMIKE
jgi:hypothetical protein